MILIRNTILSYNNNIYMCNCPQPLPPPNDQIKKCRMILQGLAGGLVIIMILAIIARDIMNVFMYLLLLYMLFMSWSQFNWCFALVFFLFSVTDFIQITILLIGMIQYKKLFSSDAMMVSVYLVVSFFYFTNAIYLSHYAYRHFKAMSQQGLLDAMNFGPPADPNRAQEGAADYRRVQEPQQANNFVFGGQGVRIG